MRASLPRRSRKYSGKRNSMRASLPRRDCAKTSNLWPKSESSPKCRVSATMSHSAAGLFKLDQVPLRPIFAV
jgi:hypothetical protein